MNYKVVRYDFKNDEREELDFDTLGQANEYIDSFVKECWIFPTIQFDIVLAMYCGSILSRYITLSNKYI